MAQLERRIDGLKAAPILPTIKVVQQPDFNVQVTVGRFTYGVTPESCCLWLPTDRIEIGAFCSVALEVRILGGGEHPLDLPSTFPLRGTLMPELANCDCFAKGPTVIGNDVWIGTRSTVLGGVHIADGAVVGASAVVTRDVDPYTIVTGNPARPVGRRFDDQKIDRLLALRWWDWSEERIRAFEPYFYSDIDTFLAVAGAENGRAGDRAAALA